MKWTKINIDKLPRWRGPCGNFKEGTYGYKDKWSDIFISLIMKSAVYVG